MLLAIMELARSVKVCLECGIDTLRCPYADVGEEGCLSCKANSWSPWHG